MWSLVIDKVVKSWCSISYIASNRANRVPARTICVLSVKIVSRACVKSIITECPKLTPFSLKNIADGTTTHAFPYLFAFVFGLVDTATIALAGYTDILLKHDVGFLLRFFLFAVSCGIVMVLSSCFSFIFL